MAKSYIRNHQAGVDVKKKKKRRRNYTFKKAGLKAEKKVQYREAKLFAKFFLNVDFSL